MYRSAHASPSGLRRRTTSALALATGARWLGQALANDGWLYAFGTGHSHMLAEEIFYRAGNPARATPMLDSRLMLHHEAIQATYNEREEGYGIKLLNSYPVAGGDILIDTSELADAATPNLFECRFLAGASADADIAAPINGAVAANANVAAPIDAAVAANIGSVDSEATAVAQQDAIINQQIDGAAEASADQQSDLEQ